MAYSKLSEMNEDNAEKLRTMFGPGHVDQMIRQAINMCWMGLPKEKRTPDQVEAEVRRLLENAFRDFRENFERFGGSGEGNNQSNRAPAFLCGSVATDCHAV